MKIALINDTHIGARNDSTIFSNYFLEFLEQDFVPYLIENKIDTIIHLGDVFDRRKYTNLRTLYEWKNRFFNKLSDANIQLHIILGNHDVYYKNTNKISTVQELVSYYDNVTVYQEPTNKRFGECDVLLLPWINQIECQNTLDIINKSHADVVMGHLEIVGFEIFGGHLNEKGLDVSTFQNFDLVLSGHFHHRSSIGNIHYLGSPYEMVWSDCNDARGYHIFDTDTKELMFLENSRRIFHKIYYDDTKAIQQEILNQDFSHYKDKYIKLIVSIKNNIFLYDTLIQKIENANVADLSIIDFGYDIDDVEESNLEGKDTLSILKEHIESLQLKNKPELIELCRKLYLEASNMVI